MVPVVREQGPEEEGKMSKTRVINKKSGEPFDVYIGRPTMFGNPYKMGDPDSEGSRNLVIIKYKIWFEDQCIAKPEFRKAVEGLRGKVLACWCKPEACHGDVIVDFLDRTEKKVPS
jgi:hypothetical protein